MLRNIASIMSLGAATSEVPNLVMMVLDDVGWADLGYHGSDFPTPNMDQLATAEGIRLEKYYVQQVCSPTRSALMTGRYPFKTGMQHCTTLMPGSSAKLPIGVPTVAEALRDRGYSTAAIGKWHLGYDSWDATPTGRGFDSFAGYLQGQTDYWNKTVGAGGGLSGMDFWKNRTCAWEEVGKYSMDFYMDEAERILDERDPTKPLFLYFAHQEIHIPLEGPPEPEYTENCKAFKNTDPDGLNRHTLCTMMSRLDQSIGDFVEMLKVRNMWENTLLWVTTDNGGMTQFQTDFPASASSNFPLRGGKTTLFEGGVRGVSFISGGLVPQVARGSAFSGLLQHVDIPVTMAAMAGVPLANSDGFNVWEAVINGRDSPRQEVPLNVDRSRLAKLCSLQSQPALSQISLPELLSKESNLLEANYSGLIQGNWKLINGFHGFYDGYWSNNPYTHIEPDLPTQGPVSVNGENAYLFDLSKDPNEFRNVAAEHVDVVLRMQARLVVLGQPENGYVPPQLNTPSARASPNHHNNTWAPWKQSNTAMQWPQHTSMV